MKGGKARLKLQSIDIAPTVLEAMFGCNKKLMLDRERDLGCAARVSNLSLHTDFAYGLNNE